jgi:transaldolase
MFAVMTSGTRLQRLFSDQGQSPWIDNLRRGYLSSGHLADLVARGVRGLTSNPTIFQKAIQGSAEYNEQFGRLASRGFTVEEIYWELVLDDIKGALEVFAPLYHESGGNDGFVSVEVDPMLAFDGAATLEAARRLDERVGASNVMIKIPATIDGLPAIRRMVAEGRNVNVTLIFSLQRYSDVIDAYISGLEDRVSQGNVSLSDVNSVASFFISRVDTEVDQRLEALGGEARARLKGRAAVTQGRLAYALFVEKFSGPRWQALADRGAKPQRPLWASTSTKNPAYPDTMYVDELIGPLTVNTLPDNTLEAFDDHGRLERTVDADLDSARATWAEIADAGVDLNEAAAKLEDEGIASFQQSFVDLLGVMQEKHDSLTRE